MTNTLVTLIAVPSAAVVSIWSVCRPASRLAVSTGSPSATDRPSICRSVGPGGATTANEAAPSSRIQSPSSVAAPPFTETTTVTPSPAGASALGTTKLP